MAVVLAPGGAFAQGPTGGKEAFQKICGECHAVEIVTSQRRTRAQWQANIASMVERGAKGSEAEMALVLDYLASEYAPSSPGGRGTAVAPAGGRAGRGAAYSPGPADRQVVDEA